MSDLPDARIDAISKGAKVESSALQYLIDEMQAMALELQRRRATPIDYRQPEEPAVRCHQDPAHSSAWCAVHDICPDWNSELLGYRGRAGWICPSGGLFDDVAGESARKAWDAAEMARIAAEHEQDIAAQKASSERVRSAAQAAVRALLDERKLYIVRPESPTMSAIALEAYGWGKACDAVALQGDDLEVLLAELADRVARLLGNPDSSGR